MDILCLNYEYTVFIPFVTIPFMSVSPTGKSERGVWGSQPGSGAFEAVESFSGCI